MSRFRVYSPDQAYLLPPSVRDELGEKHLCFFVRGVMERLDMSVFEQSYSPEGGELYAPQLMLGVWLYAYAVGITSARQVERRLVEDLAFRYLAAGERASLVPMIDQAEQRCGAPPGAALADSGFFSIENLNRMEQRNIDACVPDSNMACALNLGTRCRARACAPAHRRMRAKLRCPAGQAAYARRKAIVEPVFGVLKEQRGLRSFRTRGLAKAGTEFALASTAYNLTRMHRHR